MRERIREILSQPERVDRTITVAGWVRSKRGGKKVSFIVLNDGSCVHNLQIVADNANFDEELLKQIGTGASLRITGTLVASQGAGQALELQAQEIHLYGTADPEAFPLQKKDHTLEFLREVAHLRSRTQTFSTIMRLRSVVSQQIHAYFAQRGFYYLHTPIITASDCEGAGEMFRVTTLDPLNVPRTHEGQVDWKQDFFEREAHLTVSGQLNGELYALGLGDIYTFGPTFRAENSNTTRHLAEFWMLEPEMAFYDLQDNMALAEDLLKYLIGYCLEHYTADLEFLQEKYSEGLLDRLRFVLEGPFARVTYTDAIDLLRKSGHSFEFPVSWGIDLQTEHERWLVEQHFQKPVIVSDYPKDIKAFYMRLNDDGKTVAAMDVLFPRVGEVIGGSQREERLPMLEQRIHEMGLPYENYWWYLDTRRYGSVPHSGFGMGLERLLLFLTGMGNVRDVIPFPRTPGNAEF
jgi:asparaginyl-tRNA synthetase